MPERGCWGPSLGALLTTAQLALLPGEAVLASAADPAGAADARGDRPVVPGRRGGERVPGAGVEHRELGRGWVVRRVAAADWPSGLADGGHAFRGRRLPCRSATALHRR